MVPGLHSEIAPFSSGHLGSNPRGARARLRDAPVHRFAGDHSRRVAGTSLVLPHSMLKVRAHRLHIAMTRLCLGEAPGHHLHVTAAADLLLLAAVFALQAIVLLLAVVVNVRRRRVRRGVADLLVEE